MIMDDFDIQLCETAETENFKLLFDALGKSILEELKSFRYEMKEEVRKLNSTLQNVLLSKVDVVNAILSDCSPSWNDTDISPRGTSFCSKSNAAGLDEYQQSFNLEKNSQTLDELIADDSPSLPNLLAESRDWDKLNLEPFQTAVPSESLNKTKQKDVNPKYSKLFKISRPVEIKISKGIKNYQRTDCESSSLRQNKRTLVVATTNSAKGSSPSAYTSHSLVVDSFSKPNEKSSIHSTTTSKPSARVFGSKSIQPIKYSKQRVWPFSSLLHRYNGHINVSGLPKDSTSNLTKSKEVKKSSKQPTAVKKVRKLKNKCVYCEKLFVSQYDLMRHVRIHTGYRPYQCAYCSKAYTRNDHLKRHVMQKHHDRTTKSGESEVSSVEIETGTLSQDVVVGATPPLSSFVERDAVIARWTSSDKI